MAGTPWPEEEVVEAAENANPDEAAGPVSLVELGKRLLASSRDGDTKEVESLLSRGAPFTTDWLGTSALHLAASNGHSNTVAVLLKAGISKDSRTKVEKTPLHLSATEGHVEVVQVLLESGAEVDAKDILKMTALHWAVDRGNVTVVEVLLRYGSSVDVLSTFDKTPLDVAKDNDRPDLVEMLLDAESYRQPELDVSEKATLAATASIEKEQGEHAAIKLLEAHGITMLPEEEGQNSDNLQKSMNGSKLALTEAGKLALRKTPTKTTDKGKKVETGSNQPGGAIRIFRINPSKVVKANNTPTTQSNTSTALKTNSIISAVSNGKTAPTVGPGTKIIRCTPQQLEALKAGGAVTLGPGGLSPLATVVRPLKRKAISSTPPVVAPTPPNFTSAKKAVQIVTVNPKTTTINPTIASNNVATLTPELSNERVVNDRLRPEAPDATKQVKDKLREEVEAELKAEYEKKHESMRRKIEELERELAQGSKRVKREPTESEDRISRQLSSS